MSTEKKLKERAEERRDTKSRVTIVDKNTGKVEDVKEMTFDEAEKWAAKEIENDRENKKYRIYHVGSQSK